MKTATKTAKPNWLKAIIAMKCPNCRQGNVFRKPMRMHENCPQCGIHFEREDGYFMMAVYVGYVMSFFIGVPVVVGLYFWIRPSIWGYLIGATVALLLASPLIFHYARVVWMVIDQLLDPRREDEM
ncbi:DUF983 domain-containing protein [Candidatus Leptofilum sp.]|uniref:DUF983 domain-containing protein n=1 Tax=Candidatus Leptofilum sp. TaxID=3241576 RepID=UPI003B595E00